MAISLQRLYYSSSTLTQGPITDDVRTIGLHDIRKISLMLYRDSRMETYRSTHVTLDDPCQVRIEAGVITVEYISDGQPVTYQGREKGQGHYELHAVGFDGRATLHTFDRSTLLEGGWTEEGAKGMWRIWLR